MRSKLLGYVIAVTLGYGISGFAIPGLAQAQPKNRGGGSKAPDKTIDKQMEWENKVMGDDSAKRADLKKIAAAQKISDEAARHPQPIAAPKVKDPSKEGVRAKQEAAIGLPIASDKENLAPRKSTGAVKKAAPAPSSTNDELGALVASSLAEEKSAGVPAATSRSNRQQARAGGSASRGAGKGSRGRGRGRGATASAPAGSNSLDQMFAASGQ